MSQKIFALVPAAGAGTRLGDALPKQYLDLNGAPMIVHTLLALAGVARIEKIIVVLSPDDVQWQRVVEQHSRWHALAPRLNVLRVGGNTRGESVLNGMAAIAASVDADDWLLVHDAARPCLFPEIIEGFIDTLATDPVGGLLALPLSDTIKLATPEQRVAQTIPRENIWRAQTPQMFRFAALQAALTALPHATDESQAIEAAGLHPQLVMGDARNLKVTFATDLKLASALLNEAKPS